ncbi:MAG: SDR family NAD(P)-dependent oxidoreductase, partial [marine benthic group bacterium]|nr:SDR family NAD(P)-dependent oxidoreductase [Gemmatimonadota bacterium]
MDEQKTYLVLGGTGGIGAEVVRRLTAAGSRVLAMARGEERLDALAAETGARTVA